MGKYQSNFQIVAFIVSHSFINQFIISKGEKLMSESTRSINVTPEEIQAGKTMAIISYLIFFIPLLMDDMRNNKFVMFHTEQAIVLLLLNIAAGIVGSLTC